MKIVFFLLIALGAGLYFPQSRGVIVETARPVLDPVLRWSTRGEMRRIVRDLENRSATTRSFPSEQRQFVAWMEREYQGDATTDPWGRNYVIRMASDSFAIVSPGPDGLLDTADDVSLEGGLRDNPLGRRR